MESSLNQLQKNAEKKLVREVEASKIAVIEKHDNDFLTIENILSSHYKISRFNQRQDFQDALELLKPDLIIIDYHTPDITGIGLCEQIRQCHSFAFTPIIIMVKECFVSFEHKLWDAGCDDIIAKPFSTTTLERRVAKALKYQTLIEEYKEASMVDALTKVFNRRYLDAVMAQMVSRSDTPEISVLMIDIDFFKKYNDCYGHLAGDTSLVEVADSVKQCLLRETDFVTRWGGEEFAVILPHTDSNGLRLVAQRILKTVQERDIVHKESPYGKLTVSLGGVTLPRVGSDWKTMFEAADAQLYISKKNGRNTESLMELPFQ